ncbi:hypothetical protein V8C42DRAFT_332317 [Trichoderma barbatum]
MALPQHSSRLRMPGRLATPSSNWLAGADEATRDGTQKAQAAEEPRQLLSLVCRLSHCPRTQYSSLPCLGDPSQATATTCY